MLECDGALDGGYKIDGIGRYSNGIRDPLCDDVTEKSCRNC